MATTITLCGGDSRSSAVGSLSPSPTVFVVIGGALFPDKIFLRSHRRLFLFLRLLWWVVGGRQFVEKSDMGLLLGPDLIGVEFLPDFQGGLSSRSCATMTMSLTGVLAYFTGVGSRSVVLSVFLFAGVGSGPLALCFSIGVGSGLVLICNSWVCFVVALPLYLINSIDHLPVHLNLNYKGSSNRDPSPVQGGTLVIRWAGVPIALWHVGINSPWSRLADWTSTSLSWLFFGPVVVLGRFQGCLCTSIIP